MTHEIHHHLHHHLSDKKKFKLLHRKKSVQIIDRMVLIVGTISPLTSLPQVFEILETKSAKGVSILTWLMWVVLGVFWLVYGIAHREKPIIINNLLWIILELTIVVLALIYH